MERSQTGQRAADWIQQIIDRYPRRVAGSLSERQAHEQLMAELVAAGAHKAELVPFRHNRSLYANLALHFIIALVGSGCVVWGQGPLWCAVGLVLHGFVFASYGSVPQV